MEPVSLDHGSEDAAIEVEDGEGQRAAVVGTVDASKGGMRRHRVLVTILASFAVMTAGPVAVADAAAPAQGCFVSTVAEGTTLPANAPALVVDERSYGATAAISAELVSGDVRVPLVGPTKDTHGITILELANPSQGDHTIALNVECTRGEDTRSESSETSLVLTAPVAFPTNVGTLRLVPKEGAPDGTERVALEPSAELAAFGPIAFVSLKVGDVSQPALRNPFGAATVELRAPVGTACVENGALLREKRTVAVTVSAIIAGLAESPAPATLDVEVDCGAIAWTSMAEGSEGSVAPTPNGAASETSGGSGAGGCSASSRGPGSATNAAAAVGGFVMLAGLRRRRSPSRR